MTLVPMYVLVVEADEDEYKKDESVETVAELVNDALKAYFEMNGEKLDLNVRPLSEILSC